MAKILLIDDDPEFSETIQAELEERKHLVISRDSAEAGLRWLVSEKNKVNLILCDNRMPGGMTGLEFLRDLKDRNLRIPVILMTGEPNDDSVIQAMQMGAFAYVCKPGDLSFTPEMDAQIRKALNFIPPPQVHFPGPDSQGTKKQSIIGRCPAMIEVFKEIGLTTMHHGRVMILGETGTGKELVAKAIHTNSSRKNNPLFDINSAGLNENQYESELFGHEIGAFTGATKLRKGCFELASGGTLFFDEVGDMPLPLQAKLLRVLGTGEITRMGGSERIRVDVRVLTATHWDLEKLMNEGLFRRDLYYRLCNEVICLPPLRERGKDVELLAEHFLKEKCIEDGVTRTLHSSTVRALMEYSWPGNIRELKTVIESSVRRRCGAQIMPEDLVFVRHPVAPTIEPACTGEEGAIAALRRAITWAWENKSDVYYSLLEHLERELLTHARSQEEMTEVSLASRLGISRNNLRNLLKKYDLKGSSADNSMHVARQ